MNRLINMKKILFKENIGFSFNCTNSKLLSESAISVENGSMILKGIPATILDKKNLNGRIYSTSQIEKSLNDVKSKRFFEKRVLTCTADDHPDTSYVKPANSSHVIIDAYIKEVNGENILMNDILILDTFQGKNLQALIKDGVSVGTSIRGMGVMNESTGEVEEYEYLGTDIVGQPSAGTYIENHNIEVVFEKRKNGNLVNESMSDSKTKKIEELEDKILSNNEDDDDKEKSQEEFDINDKIEKDDEEDENFEENLDKEWDVDSEVISQPLPKEGEVDMNKADGEDQPVQENIRMKARNRIKSELSLENEKLEKKYKIALQLIERLKSKVESKDGDKELESFIKKSISVTESHLKQIDEGKEKVLSLSLKNKKIEEQNSKLKKALVVYSNVSKKILESFKKSDLINESKEELQYFTSLESRVIQG